MNLRSALFAALALSVVAAAPALAHAPASTTARASAPKAVVTPNGAWTTYHHDDGHTGYDPSAPAITSVQAGWVSPTLDGEIYAEPLVYNGIVYAATLNDTVYALNQSDGTLLWSKNVGAPQMSGWSCSTLTPGILSTPVIDTVANRIYVAAEMAAVGSTLPTYHLFGLDLGNVGNILLNVPIAPAGFDWQVQQQRGALAVANGYVYVPFGGRGGDCFRRRNDEHFPKPELGHPNHGCWQLGGGRHGDRRLVAQRLPCHRKRHPVLGSGPERLDHQDQPRPRFLDLLPAAGLVEQLVRT